MLGGNGPAKIPIEQLKRGVLVAVSYCILLCGKFGPIPDGRVCCLAISPACQTAQLRDGEVEGWACNTHHRTN